jgi:hypothetical protein
VNPAGSRSAERFGILGRSASAASAAAVGASLWSLNRGAKLEITLQAQRRK